MIRETTERDVPFIFRKQFKSKVDLIQGKKEQKKN